MKSWLERSKFSKLNVLMIQFWVFCICNVFKNINFIWIIVTVEKLKMDHSHHDHSAHMHAMSSDDHNHGQEDGQCDSMHAMVVSTQLYIESSYPFEVYYNQKWK